MASSLYPNTSENRPHSISTETTFSQDLSDPETLRMYLLELTDHLASRLRFVGIQARTIELKIRSSDFRTRHRGQALRVPTNRTDMLWQAAKSLLERCLSRDLLPVRLLGVGATRLTRDTSVQGELFETDRRRRQESLDNTIDAVRGQFGAKSIRRASLLDRATDDQQ